MLVDRLGSPTCMLVVLILGDGRRQRAKLGKDLARVQLCDNTDQAVFRFMNNDARSSCKWERPGPRLLSA